MPDYICADVSFISSTPQLNLKLDNNNAVHVILTVLQWTQTWAKTLTAFNITLVCVGRNIGKLEN